MAESRESSQDTSRNRIPFNHNPGKDINILLLGETGVGKTTFINAFANYLTYNTLMAALSGEMQILIPCVFSVSDSDTHTHTPIKVGSHDDNELCEDNGKSQTQGCKSYLFSIGDRFLRLIDTPGVGDCRGVEQDNKNFDHILAFVSRYEHLNAICIMLKPNENRLNIFFKYGIKELLRHLHVNAKDNVMFIFTNARANFYMPGATSNQLRILLDELERSTQVQVPFTKENTFIFDNESFRYLAVNKVGCDFFKDHENIFIDSWKKSVDELCRMLARIVKCDLHAVRDMQSLNEAHQLIRKLTRPIGEVATLIQENIQLAEQHKCKVSANANDITPSRMPQKTAKVVSLEYPRTICTSKKCSTVVKVNDEIKMDYNVQCHKHCYLKGVEQEVINNPILKHCRAIDKRTGICKRCSCEWKTHIHVTYEFQKQLTYLVMDNEHVTSSSQSVISSIDRRIHELKQEEQIILHICTNLTLFLRMSSINPIDEDIVEYINHFIREEKEKGIAGDKNEEIIHRLECLIAEYRAAFNLINSNVINETDRSYTPTIEEIFTCKLQLFELPITGKYIEDQVESLNSNQMNLAAQREHYIDLPQSAKSSSTMKVLKKLLA
ncbi:unnamed protein product [Rotaria socialis]|uniref:DUF8206 domain-containing protein n=1 Tax=Rotaria socialis TaxID=392032 RepID=A0A818EKS2_9BILA|nr:unnamed protein product [Rotaria socialis]CAF3460243.1 unnamed protein product [Rotaria socialis]CAF3511468.1 unnamed protein product [Rotaria socialis]CAF4355288.1 unnamed protein product [Rotaria socialis]CAF4507714.1 unnamed protein product [Rotaria socialis]